MIPPLNDLAIAISKAELAGMRGKLAGPRGHDQSRSNTEGDGLGSGLAILETFCQDAKGEDLSFGHGIVRGIAMRENAGKLRYFGKPPAVFFALAFDVEIHALAILRAAPRLDPRRSSARPPQRKDA